MVVSVRPGCQRCRLRSRGVRRSLPAPEKSWALITAASTPVGQEMARLCGQRGFSLIVVDDPDRSPELEALAAELKAQGRSVRQETLDLGATSARSLHRNLRQGGLEIELLVASPRAMAGPLLEEEGLQGVVSMISSTAALCSSFGGDMVAAGRGRLIIAPDGEAPLLRNYVDRLENELASSGVDVSYLDLDGKSLPSALEQLLSAPGESNKSSRALRSTYVQLAKERDFPILPFAAEIDEWQRRELVEIINALLVGLTCLCFALRTVPSFANMQVLSDIETFAALAFAVDYVLRWYSRGLRPDFLLSKYMIADLLSLLAFTSPSLDLNFLRLLRTVRIYRLLQPLKVRKVYKIFGIQSEEALPRPSQLVTLRAFGAVFTLLFITAGLVYTAENGVNPQFQNFFSAFYFSVTALSTVGFGDIYPITETGRLIVSLAIPIGLCLVPFQAGEVAAAFAEEERLKSLKYQRKQASKDEQIARLIDSLERERSKTSSNALRLEMLQDLQSQRTKPVQELRELFNKYDADGNGSIDFAEFLLMSEALGLV